VYGTGPIPVSAKQWVTTCYSPFFSGTLSGGVTLSLAAIDVELGL